MDLKKVSKEVKNIVDSEFKGISYQMPNDKGSIYTVKPKTYLQDLTNDDEGNFGFQVRVMLEKKGILRKLETYLGNFSLMEDKDNLRVSFSDSSNNLTKEKFEKIIYNIEEKYNTKVKKNYFSAEEYHETSGGIL
jgi:hypothetical protein